jgi:hypothetical protein
MLPKLSELLENRITLVLGAGASMDYGFPSWLELKNGLIEELNKNHGSLKNQAAIDWWKETLNSMSPDQTIDIIATNAPEDYFDTFRILLSLLICRYEEQDKNDKKTGWIEKFAEKYFQLIESAYPDTEKILKLLTNLNIVTLNYDRVFNIRFYGAIEVNLKSILQKPREFQKVFEQTLSSKAKILHPHGCVGCSGSNEFAIPHAYTYLNPNQLPGVDYGNVGDLRRNINNGQISPILPVDDLKDGKNWTYNEVNIVLKDSRYAICIGLSENGITNSALQLESLEKVYYSGSEKIYDNFVPLNLRAMPIVNHL